MFLLYLWDSLVTLELISLIPLVGPSHTDPLAVKLLDNRLYIFVFQITIIVDEPPPLEAIPSTSLNVITIERPKGKSFFIQNSGYPNTGLIQFSNYGN